MNIVRTLLIILGAIGMLYVVLAVFNQKDGVHGFELVHDHSARRMNGAELPQYSSKHDQKATGSHSTHQHDDSDSAVPGHDHGLAMNDSLDSVMSDSFQTREHWFEAADIAKGSHPDDQFYLAEDAALTIDASCQNVQRVKPELSFQENLQKEYGVNVREKDVSDTFFKSVSHFFTYNDRFFQASLIWDYDMPAVYRMEFFSAEDAAFTQDVQVEKPPVDFPAYADAIASLEWLDTLIARYIGEGALEGQRIVEQRVMDERGKSHEWVSMNGRVLSWNASDATCILDSTGSVGRCVCNV